MAARPKKRVPPTMAEHLSPQQESLDDDIELAGVVVSGDHSGIDVGGVDIADSRIDRAPFIGSHLRRCRLTDCRIAASDLSGAFLDNCHLGRVEFHDCRLSGLQAQESRFHDVGFFGCRIDGANFRMTRWERAEFVDCDLVDSDFYAAQMPGTRFEGCDLTGVELSKSDLTGSSVRRSTLERISGADRLRGITIGSDQIIPTALAIFGALGITVSDEEH